MSNEPPALAQDSFNGAAIIDAQGVETAITELMIQQACAVLEQQWQPACASTDQLTAIPHPVS